MVDEITIVGKRTLTNGAILDDCAQNRKQSTVNGIAATQQDENCMATHHATYFSTGSKFIQVMWAEVFDKNYSEYSKILSTFTFLDETAGWKMYTNSKYGYSLKYPATYSIREDASSDEEVVFGCGKATECRDAVKVFSTFGSLEKWKSSIDQTIILSTTNTLVNGVAALRVTTGEFATTKVGVYKNGVLYEISGNSFLDNGLLSTFTFTK